MRVGQETGVFGEQKKGNDVRSSRVIKQIAINYHRALQFLIRNNEMLATAA
jgi:hypothetical protein